MGPRIRATVGEAVGKRRWRRACRALVLPALLVLLAAACRQAWEAPEEPAPGGLANSLRWSTRSEVANTGFHVLRGETELGPFEQRTREPIPGAGTTSARHEYEWVDRFVEPGREYYYYVESVTGSGRRVRVTPVIRAAPKAAPKDWDDPGPQER